MSSLARDKDIGLKFSADTLLFYRNVEREITMFYHPTAGHVNFMKVFDVLKFQMSYITTT